MGKSLPIISAVVIGFVGGILFAPKSGKAMRQDIMRRKDEFQDKAQRGLDTVLDGVDVVKDEAISRAKEVKDIAKEK